MLIIGIQKAVLEDRFVHAGNDVFLCQRCMGQCETILVFVTVQLAMFDDVNAGSGRVVQVLVPYCVDCGDPVPTGGGSVCTDMMENTIISLTIGYMEVP